uniref:Uncharacterized protein n=1 Tax=Arundo donax TaxID=35708 RepID=A0A0A9CD12_ARUDO
MQMVMCLCHGSLLVWNLDAWSLFDQMNS